MIKKKTNKDTNRATIVYDKGLDYEKKRFAYYLALPIMNLLAVWVLIKKAIARKIGYKIYTNTFWFDGLCKESRMVKEDATTAQALNFLYNYEFNIRSGIKGRFADFWGAMINVQALRNRFKIVKRELTKAVEELRTLDEVRIVSIAAGSAQAVLEVIEKAVQGGANIKGLILDLDPRAIEYSRKLAGQKKLADRIVFVNKGANSIQKSCRDFRPHIIEMVGFMDYRPHKRAIRLVQRIYSLLEPSGFFITCNIRHNREAFFLKYVVDWEMIYRSPEMLADIISRGGFSPEATKIIYEPHKIHGVVVARKTGGP